MRKGTLATHEHMKLKQMQRQYGSHTGIGTTAQPPNSHSLGHAWLQQAWESVCRASCSRNK
ncbi:hypothetical protein E2C01_013356 [Portunus trituberculatus]|uniref:Uncharacterized protein n=1 Tax=Portunus trituberculatus TaxID=210409 RepID=A0A5B7DGX0_PORTR|nr:hypothetical protein [Portunus trituberculatus]